MKLFLLRLLRKLGLLKHVRITLPLRMNNSRFRIPVVDTVGIEHFYKSEYWMDGLIAKLCSSKDGLFVDVGVNVGQTLLKLKSVSPNTPYIGFEPNPTCLYYLKYLVDFNAFNCVTIFPTGIFSFDGLAKLFVTRDNLADSCATLIEDFRIHDGGSIHVPVVSARSLATLFDQNISIIKIDVEGSELEVLRQLKETISKWRPFIICEILPAYSEENSFRITRHREIEIMIKQLDYCLLRVTDNNLIRTDRIPINCPIYESNYLLVPNEMLIVIEKEFLIV